MPNRAVRRTNNSESSPEPQNLWKTIDTDKGNQRRFKVSPRLQLYISKKEGLNHKIFPGSFRGSHTVLYLLSQDLGASSPSCKTAIRRRGDCVHSPITHRASMKPLHFMKRLMLYVNVKEAVGSEKGTAKKSLWLFPTPQV